VRDRDAVADAGGHHRLAPHHAIEDLALALEAVRRFEQLTSSTSASRLVRAARRNETALEFRSSESRMGPPSPNDRSRSFAERPPQQRDAL
jgi:hypothetical protein